MKLIYLDRLLKIGTYKCYIKSVKIIFDIHVRMFRTSKEVHFKVFRTDMVFFFFRVFRTGIVFILECLEQNWYY